MVAIERGLREQYLSDFRSVYDQNLYESVLDATLCDEQMNFLVNDSIGLQCEYLYFFEYLHVIRAK